MSSKRPGSLEELVLPSLNTMGTEQSHRAPPARSGVIQQGTLAGCLNPARFSREQLLHLKTA